MGTVNAGDAVSENLEFARKLAVEFFPVPSRLTLATIDKHIAAAEERGRRRGVEEAINLMPIAQGYGPDLRRKLRTALLAPRDSTLNAKVGRSEDGLPVVNFDRDALHERAPRDSGKVCTCDAPLADGHWSTCALSRPRDSGKEG